MKNFNRGGRGMAVGQSERVNMLSCEQGLHECPKEESNRLRDRLLLPLGRYRSDVLLIIFCVLFSGLLVAPALGQEAKGLNNVRPLKVGDQIPDELWDMPLKVVNHPEGKEYIRLSDYRCKKLIVLEFWGTWCGSCIAALPLAKNVQNEFVKDLLVIPVTFEPADKVKTFIAKNEIARNVNLWSVVEDSTITSWVTKFTYPHFTWIADDKVFSHTSESALNVSFVDDYLTKGLKRWGEKVNLDQEDAFLHTLSHLSRVSTSFYYEGYLDGAGKGAGMLAYDKDRTYYNFINFTRREVDEWLIKRLARRKGEILHDIQYDLSFTTSDRWKEYNESFVTFQVITGKDRPLKDIFKQWKLLSSYELDRGQDGRFNARDSGKEEVL